MTKKAAPLAAALTFEIELDGQGSTGVSAPARLRVIPDGEFSGIDGRPRGMEGVKATKWVMNAQVAASVINRFQERRLKLVVEGDVPRLHHS